MNPFKDTHNLFFLGFVKDFQNLQISVAFDCLPNGLYSYGQQ